MSINLTPGVRFQRDQMIPIGCCFRVLMENPIKGVQQIKMRVHSEPKQCREKKIEVTISRRGFSQTNQIHDIPIKKKRERLVPHNLSAKKISENWKGFSSLASKLTEQKSSSKQSKVTFDRNIKMEGKIQNVNFQKQLRSTLPPEMSNNKNQISILSQISVVEQSFISPHSLTNPLYAFISSQNGGQNDNIRESYRSLLSNNKSGSKQMINPFQKLMQGSNIAKAHYKLYI